eukprot:Platyproteum_vivax@DN5958_c0_g1_i2.p1
MKMTTLILGCVLRVGLHYCRLGPFLETQVLVSSRMTDFTGLREAWFLEDVGMDSYSNDVRRVVPLVGKILQVFKDLDEIYFLLFLTFIDACIAYCLGRISNWYNLQNPWLKQGVLNSSTISAIFFLNPLVIASTLSLSLQNLHGLFITLALYTAFTSRPFLTALLTSCLHYLMPLSPLPLVVAHAALLCLPAPVKVVVAKPKGPVKLLDWTDWLVLTATILLGISVVSILVSLMIASYFVNGKSWSFIDSVYLANLEVRDLTPNIGIFWYIGTEVFGRFRFFFLTIFRLHFFMYSVPLYVRLRHQPLALGVAMTSIVLLYQPYPTVLDWSLIVSLLLLMPDVLTRAKHFFVLLKISAFGLALFPIMSDLWLNRNTGNANFLYNMNLVNHVVTGLMLVSWIESAIQQKNTTYLQIACKEIITSLVDEAVEKSQKNKK